MRRMQEVIYENMCFWKILRYIGDEVAAVAKSEVNYRWELDLIYGRGFSAKYDPRKNRISW